MLLHGTPRYEQVLACPVTRISVWDGVYPEMWQDYREAIVSQVVQVCEDVPGVSCQPEPELHWRFRGSARMNPKKRLSSSQSLCWCFQGIVPRFSLCCKDIPGKTARTLQGRDRTDCAEESLQTITVTRRFVKTWLKKSPSTRRKNVGITCLWIRAESQL